MFNKFRINLTILNTVVLTVILTIISVFVYLLMHYNLHSGIDEDLINSSHQVENYVNFLQKDTTADQMDVDKQNEYSRIIHNMIRNNITYIVWDAEQSINIHSNFRELDDDILLSIRKDVMNRLENSEKVVQDLDRSFYFQTLNKDGINYRVSTTFLQTGTDGNNIRTIQTIKTLRHEKDVLNRLGFTLLSNILIGVTLSLLGGYFLAGRSLVPVIKSWKRQQEFVADASHELRTPLAVVQTNLEVVRGSNKESVESQKYWLNNAYDETLRMNRIIEDLLFLARVDSGEDVMEKEKVDISFLLQDVNEKLMSLAVDKKIQIYGDIEENLFINGDANKIRQLMIILIDNAIKYSLESSIITIRAKAIKQGVNIEVIDQGMGMKPEDLTRVFDRFYRSDKVRSREHGGTGLGLSIAKWIVDIHKGKINIESEMTKGTKVSVFLPSN